MIKRKVNTATNKEARSEISYFDDDQNPVSREKATWAVFREVDENGNLLFEVQGFID